MDTVGFAAYLDIAGSVDQQEPQEHRVSLAIAVLLERRVKAVTQDSRVSRDTQGLVGILDSLLQVLVKADIPVSVAFRVIRDSLERADTAVSVVFQGTRGLVHYLDIPGSAGLD